MKIKILTHSSNLNHIGYLKFKQSMEKFNYDWHTLSDPEFNWSYNAYKPFYKWCKNNSEGYTHFVLHDSWDGVAIAPMTELYEKYRNHNVAIISGEKGLYPNTDLGKYYPKTDSRWSYCNGGAYLFPIDSFIRMYEDFPMGDTNAQEWITQNYLFNNKNYVVDTNCDIFQSIAFEDKDEFAITRDGRLLNRYTNTLPIFIHANGSQKPVESWVTNPLL